MYFTSVSDQASCRLRAGTIASVGRLALLTSLLAFMAVVPCSASAAVRVIGANTTAVVDLGGPDGSLLISHREAYVSSSRGHTFTTFSAPARATRTALLARFGSLGRVDLSFEPTGRPSRNEPSSFCKGGTQFTWKGTFRGIVELKGRFGFRPIHESSFSAEGSITRSPRLVCRNLPEPKFPEGSGDGVGLWAQTCDGRGFSVQGRRPSAGGSDRVSYSGSATRKVGRAEVTQVLNASAPAKAFAFDEALTSATVKPPPPFLGSATLTRAPDGSTDWSGSLSATILGRRVSLAGPEFHTEFRSFPVSPGTFVIFAFSLPSCSDKKQKLLWRMFESQSWSIEQISRRNQAREPKSIKPRGGQTALRASAPAA